MSQASQRRNSFLTLDRRQVRAFVHRPLNARAEARDELAQDARRDERGGDDHAHPNAAGRESEGQLFPVEVEIDGELHVSGVRPGRLKERPRQRIGAGCSYLF